MMHKAWSGIEEVPYCFSRSSIKFQGHTAQKIVDFDPNWAFPDYRPVTAFKSLRFALLLMDLLIHMFIFIFYRNSFYMFILMILSLSYPYMPYVSLNYVLCWCFVVMYINCVVVYGRTSCNTASGWWVILVKYVLIKKKKKKFLFAGINSLRPSDAYMRW